MTQVFVSHTKEDKGFSDLFDNVVARVEIKAFHSKFERIGAPPWETIKEAMNNSVALFFLVGKELVKNQELRGSGWRHTQNWIAYEIGLACQRGIDVWAICDDVVINFPMPYINNYLTVSLENEKAFEYIKEVLENYKKRRRFTYPYIDSFGNNTGTNCPHQDCRMGFNLHVSLQPNKEIRCPQCLEWMEFPKGHLLR